MKKLERLTLKELGNSFGLMDAAVANGLKGGTTPDEMYAAVNAGTWTGGMVDGMGYVAGVVTVVADVSYVTCGTVDALNRSTGGTYSQVFANVLLDVAANTNPITANFKDGLDVAVNIGQIVWDTAKKNAVADVLRMGGYTIDSNICWSTRNNKLVVYDNNGNTIWESD